MLTLFEIHITTTELNEPLIEEFVAFCAMIDAKPIIIELPVGQQMQQPMISKVVKLEDPQKIHPIITVLESAFVAAGFPVERVKVEVPLEHEEQGKAAFPDFTGGYYEWHGRVKTEHPEDLIEFCEDSSLHASRSTLRGKAGRRFVTLRDYSNAKVFRQRIELSKTMLAANNFLVEKDEAECCVYDSNKLLDRGWSDVPDVTEPHYYEQRAFDAFLRKVSQVDAPFMVKGSVIMRQYLAAPRDRNAHDLDFFYIHPLPPEEAEKVFTDWLLQVTETVVEGDEDVVIRSFREDIFWRCIDYSLNDDFPTTNTDIQCQIGDQPPFKFGLDISWNLPLSVPPVPLEYRPVKGETFVLPLTVPLALQISWKLHQSVVSPRHKDITDLIGLLDHPLVDQQTIREAATAFQVECQKDSIWPGRLGVYFQSDVDQRILPKNSDLSYLSKTMVCYAFERRSRREFRLPEVRFFYNLGKQQIRELPSLLQRFRLVLMQSGIGECLGLPFKMIASNN